MNNFKKAMTKLFNHYQNYQYDQDLAMVPAHEVWKNQSLNIYFENNNYQTKTVSGKGIYQYVSFFVDTLDVKDVNISRIRFNQNEQMQSGFLLVKNPDDELLIRCAELIKLNLFNNIVIMPDGHLTKDNIVGFSARAKQDDNLVILPSIVGADIGCGVLSADFNHELFKDLSDEEIAKMFSALDQGVVNLIPAGQAAQHDLNQLKAGQFYQNSFDQSFFELVEKQVESFLKQTYFYHKLDPRAQVLLKNNIIANSATLGDGNHFIEINKSGSKSALKNNQKWTLNIHSGSRTFGGAIYQYYQKQAQAIIKSKREAFINANKEQVKNMKQLYNQQKISGQALNDWFANYKAQLASDNVAILKDKLAWEYFHDVQVGQNYGCFNRELMMLMIENYFAQHVIKNVNLLPIFNTNHYHNIHNSAFKIGNEIVLLKGTILGQVLDISATKDNIHPNHIPLNMRDGIIVTYPVYDYQSEHSGALFNYALPHGAGRYRSRSAFRKTDPDANLEQFQKQMVGVVSSCVNHDTIDESPKAYKNQNEIISQSKMLFNEFEIQQPVYAFKGHNQLPFKKQQRQIKRANGEYDHNYLKSCLKKQLSKTMS